MDHDLYPRVLVVSHEAFSRNTSMGRTMASYFKGWKDECLAQLFIHSEVPTSDVCHRYYRYTDVDALISLIDRKRVGQRIDSVETARADAADMGRFEIAYRLGSRKKVLTYILRDWLWKHSTWHSGHLMEWIREFDPQIIFFAAGDYIFSNDMAVTLSEELDIPLVTCCMDDYYIFDKDQDSRLGRERQKQFMDSVRKLIGRSQCIFTISELMAEAYGELFGRECKVLYTASSFRHTEGGGTSGSGISYLGGLGYNRNLQLVRIGRILAEMSDDVIPDHLDVYSGDSDPKLFSCFESEPAVRFHGSVSSEEVCRIIENSTAVVHTESFDETNRQRVRFSVSTKIPDSLASGTCILAFGPRDVASIDYLDSHDCAFVAENDDELKNCIYTIFHDEETRGKVIRNALRLAEENHNADSIPGYVRDSLIDHISPKNITGGAQMNKTLVILAAGIGSRYGGGIKQIEPVGENGEIIIEFSIHDAIAAGFNRIVIVIREDIEDDFNEVLGDRLKKISEKLGVELCYAFQNHPLNEPELYPEGRKKPWGTGDAVMACGELISGPFTVINADDYYGKTAFIKASALLDEGGYGMIGYRLGNKLSDTGAVTRGICEVSDGVLVDITETSNIVKTDGGAEADGRQLSLDSVVSMNLWCLPEEFMDELRSGFSEFRDGMKDPLKDEYLLPTIIKDVVKKGMTVKVEESDDMWFGVTYHEDKEYVVGEFRKLYDAGVYQADLYADLLH